eukprot:CAMPEP_0206233794 /NCGR_PEP_ID=MMETSP0047_2-20121206/12213_1 /ASSEMBLY_ACC=CAM_ASM_000192 /TAXON_ID=195065 /ORGANISM="Chroomonas mesostigmatica_cf, Strain CCMP1168" /LENGTH=82 /DNA_ID=CAMNT_0053657769 /DNA_START=698 /DNA_END=942 /DNA_ORIENTATION=-
MKDIPSAATPPRGPAAPRRALGGRRAGGGGTAVLEGEGACGGAPDGDAWHGEGARRAKDEEEPESAPPHHPDQALRLETPQS